MEPAAVIAGAEADGPLVPWSFGDGVPVELQDREHALRVLRESLGAEGYERAAAVGAAMTFDEVVEYTLDELERLSAATRDG